MKKKLIEKHLKIFGEIGIVTKSNISKINSKLSDRGVPCIFLGYARIMHPMCVEITPCGDSFSVLHSIKGASEGKQYTTCQDD
jgi:hypothetical protein